MFCISDSSDKLVTAFRKLFKRDLKINNNVVEDVNKQEKNSNPNNHADKNNKVGNHAKENSSVNKNTNSVSNNAITTKSNLKNVRINRLMKELSDLQKLSQSTTPPVLLVDLINDKLDEWTVKIPITSIDSSSDLCADMTMLKIQNIVLHIEFPSSFPFTPPFLRVVSPTIEKGFVMEGGALCLELLTPRGWSSAYSIESVLMQFTASVVKGHGRISKTLNKSKSFSKKTAEESFRHLVQTHDKYGWVTPPLSEG